MGYFLSTSVVAAIVILNVSVYTVNASCVQTEAANLMACSQRMMTAMGLDLQSIEAGNTPQLDLNQMMRGICSPSGRAALKCMADIISRCPEIRSMVQTQNAFGTMDLQSLMNSNKLEQACSAIGTYIPSSNGNQGANQNANQGANPNGNDTGAGNLVKSNLVAYVCAMVLALLLARM